MKKTQEDSAVWNGQKITTVKETRMKMVKIRDDAIEMFDSDTSWDGVDQFTKMIGRRTLKQMVGRSFPVVGGQVMQGRQFVKVPVVPAITVSVEEYEDTNSRMMKISETLIPTDYTKVVDIGFMRAD